MNNVIFRDSIHVRLYLKKKFGLPDEAIFQQIKTKPIIDTCMEIRLSKSLQKDATEKEKKVALIISKIITDQKTYMFMTNKEEYLFEQPDGTHESMHFAVGPYKNGVECYIIYADGTYERIDSTDDPQTP